MSALIMLAVFVGLMLLVFIYAANVRQRPARFVEIGRSMAESWRNVQFAIGVAFLPVMRGVIEAAIQAEEALAKAERDRLLTHPHPRRPPRGTSNPRPRYFNLNRPRRSRRTTDETPVSSMTAMTSSQNCSHSSRPIRTRAYPSRSSSETPPAQSSADSEPSGMPRMSPPSVLASSVPMESPATTTKFSEESLGDALPPNTFSCMMHMLAVSKTPRSLEGSFCYESTNHPHCRRTQKKGSAM